MNFEQLNFTVYCIDSIAEALKMNVRKVSATKNWNFEGHYPELQCIVYVQ